MIYNFNKIGSTAANEMLEKITIMSIISLGRIGILTSKLRLEDTITEVENSIFSVGKLVSRQ